MISPLHASEHPILIVDAERPVRDAVGGYLGAYGFTVDTAGGLEEAEALLAAGRYSLMIADPCLTGPHGREGLDLVDSARRHCVHIRVIVLTAHAAGDFEREARRRGADAFVEKPLVLSDLLFEVHRLVDGSRAHAAPGAAR